MGSRSEIDYTLLGDIYPGYNDGDTIVPSLLLEGMIKAQKNLAKLTQDSTEHETNVAAAEYDVERLEREIADMVDAQMIGDIPSENRKNKELTMAWIKFGSSISNRYKVKSAELEKAKKVMVDAKALQRKYKQLIKVLENAIETGTMVLSWMKHEERGYRS